MVNDTGADLFNEFEEKFKSFVFKAVSFTQGNWNGTSVIKNVCQKNRNEISKSTEDDILNRLNIWFDECRINNEIINENNTPGNENGFRKAGNRYRSKSRDRSKPRDRSENEEIYRHEKKRKSEKKSKESKTQLRTSISLESIDIYSAYTNHDHAAKKKMGFPFSHHQKSKHNKSTTDLINPTDSSLNDIRFSESSSISTTSTDESIGKSDKREKSLFNIFGRKSFESKSSPEDSKHKNNKWHFRTPKLRRKRNSGITRGTLKHVRSGADIIYDIKLPLPPNVTPNSEKNGANSNKSNEKPGAGSTPCNRKYNRNSIPPKCNTDETQRRMRDLNLNSNFNYISDSDDEFGINGPYSSNENLGPYSSNEHLDNNDATGEFYRALSYDESIVSRSVYSTDSDEEINTKKLIQDECRKIQLLNENSFGDDKGDETTSSVEKSFERDAARGRIGSVDQSTSNTLQNDDAQNIRSNESSNILQIPTIKNTNGTHILQKKSPNCAQSTPNKRTKSAQFATYKDSDKTQLLTNRSPNGTHTGLYNSKILQQQVNVDDTAFADTLQETEDTIRQYTNEIKNLLNSPKSKKGYTNLPVPIKPMDLPSQNRSSKYTSTPDISIMPHGGGNKGTEAKKLRDFRYSWSDSMIIPPNTECNCRVEYIGYI